MVFHRPVNIIEMIGWNYLILVLTRRIFSQVEIQILERVLGIRIDLRFTFPGLGSTRIRQWVVLFWAFGGKEYRNKHSTECSEKSGELRGWVNGNSSTMWREQWAPLVERLRGWLLQWGFCQRVYGEQWASLQSRTAAVRRRSLCPLPLVVT